MTTEYLKIIEQRYFDQTPDGKVVFFPHGKLKNGFELTPDLEKKARGFFKKHVITTLLILFSGSVFSLVPISFVSSLIVGATLLTINRIFFLCFVRKLTRHLPVVKKQKPPAPIFSSLSLRSSNFLLAFNILLAILSVTTIWFAIRNPNIMLVCLALINGTMFFASIIVLIKKINDNGK